MGVGAERSAHEIDPAADFDLLYEQFRLPIYRAIRGIVLDGAAAEDLTQETFERAYKARGQFRTGSSPGAWLHRIGVNVAISYVRRQRLARLVLPRLYVPQAPPDEQVEDRTLAVRALSALSPKLSYTFTVQAVNPGGPPGGVSVGWDPRIEYVAFGPPVSTAIVQRRSPSCGTSVSVADGEMML